MSDTTPIHKRSRSAVTRALQRISSRGDVPQINTIPDDDTAPPVPAVPSPVDNMASPVDGTNSSVYLSPARASMQSNRPHLSTTMSNVTTSPSSPSRDNASQQEVPYIAPTATQGASIEQSVRLFKIFEALRSGDTAAIAKAAKADNGSGLAGTTMLHLAIQCADPAVIEYVLSQPETDINAKDSDGNTALHVASGLGRGPVVKLLLEQKSLNDSVVNYQGKTALDLARNPDIHQQLQLARSMYIDAQVRKIHQLLARGDHAGFEQLLSDSRLRSVMDINEPELATDPATTADGGSLLHEAARKKDIQLAQILLLNGADPFRRDRKGKLPQDVTKDERTRAILKKSPAAAAAQRNIQEKTILGETASTGAIANLEGGPGSKESREMKGYLKKWTNYTSGYKLRWFVLEDGVLSYYKHQDDAGSACRGAINMRIAKLHMDPKDKLHFEIHGKSSVKYDLKANHQVEAKRWFWALNNAIQWTKDEAKEEAKRQKMAREVQIERVRTREVDAPSGSFTNLAPGAGGSVGGVSTPLVGSTLAESITGVDASDIDAASATGGGGRKMSRATATIDGDGDDEEEVDYADDASSHDNAIRPANRDAFSITAQSAKLQLDLLQQVSNALQSEAAKNPALELGSPTVSQALGSYDVAVGNLKGLLVDLLRISRDHEAYWNYRLEREQTMRRLWEDSMAKVAREQEELENRIGESEDKRKRTKRALREVLDQQAGAGTPPATTAGAGAGGEKGMMLAAPVVSASNRRATISQLTNNEISDDEDEDEEEFFDAVDAGEVEVVERLPVIKSPVQSPGLGVEEGEKRVEGDDRGMEEKVEEKKQQIEKSYRGYEDGVRKKLRLEADNRPKVSLWGILKSMIGKDMTKMTLPVSFNEPISLLYRVVEDMEYTDLLDTAAARADSTERLVYVAGFAASEYASTIGRVAKPFNPLLGETYEYVRPDLGYRFFIEQVSHHPPIGAAYAESARWTYYGESAVKSKFYGKSFEINPLGTWFLHLRPTNGGPEELYTWKKVTSCVVGIITGNPVVDNYGLMEIKNWNTGEVCLLDFKPRGWKASSAYQVAGKVLDAQGNTRWSIGGRWNDKIYARLTPGYEATVEGLGSGGNEKAFLVWEAHYRPPAGQIPFNITPFAVTLNDLPERLRGLIAPTDSRLRPDQRAMEEGEYDLAAVEKNRVEEGQRARRKVREQKGEEFVPRWFRMEKHPITGEDYWRFNEEYWKVREEVAEGKRKWDQERLEEIF